LAYIVHESFLGGSGNSNKSDKYQNYSACTFPSQEVMAEVVAKEVAN